MTGPHFPRVIKKTEEKFLGRGKKENISERRCDKSKG